MAYFNNLTVGGTAKFLQDVKWPGLKSTVDELNYLHTEAVTKDGILFTNSTPYDVEMDGIAIKNSGTLGLIADNSYTITATVDSETATLTATAFSVSSDDIGISGVVAIDFDGWVIYDNTHTADGETWYNDGHMWTIPSELGASSILLTGTGTNGTLTHIEYEYGKVPYENLELAPVIEQYYEWTSSDVIPVKGQITVTGEIVTFMRPSPLYNRCEIISRWKEINRSDVFDEYVSPTGLMAAPFDANGEYAAVEGTYITGNASDSVYLGTGNETTTTAYNEWYVTEQYTVLFDEKGMFVRQTSMAAPDEEGTTKTITETEDHPGYAIRSYAYGVDRNSDINPFTDKGITWGFITTVRKTRGSYIQLRWYQD